MPDPLPDPLIEIRRGVEEALIVRQYLTYRNVQGESRTFRVVLKHDFTSIPSVGGPVTTRQADKIFVLGPGQEAELRPVRHQFFEGQAAGEMNKYEKRSVTEV